MGKIVMLSGLYIIFGMYILAFNRADESMFQTSMHLVNTVQAEQLVNTGIAIGLGDMGNNALEPNHSATVKNLGDGSVTYTITRTGTTATIFATSTYYGITQSATCYVNYDRGRWRKIRTYSYN